MPVPISAGDWGPCLSCGTRIHRYGPGCRTRCEQCDPIRAKSGRCYQCGTTGDFPPYRNGRLCPACAPPSQRPNVVAGRAPVRVPHDRARASRTRAYERRHIRLVLLHDLLASKVPASGLDQPIGGLRASERACSVCRQPTVFTTPRGRSVHPGCEGWLDTLTDDAFTDLAWHIGDVIPVAAQLDVEMLRVEL